MASTGEISGEEEKFKCTYCVFSSCGFSEIIDHCVIRHPSNELKIKKLTFLSEANKARAWQSKNFKVIPEDIQRQDSFIYVEDNDRETVKNSKLSIPSPLFSPVRKKVKLATSTPLKKSLFQNVCSDNEEPHSLVVNIDDDSGNKKSHIDHEKEEADDMDISIGMINLSISHTEKDKEDTEKDKEENEDGNNTEELKELCNLLPKVLENLKEEDQMETYMKFNRLVAEDSFPLQNIAYLLFLDVVNWFSVETTSQMRYSDEVKKFWRVGLKLFKGKFIRFMSGMNNSGQTYADSAERGMCKPSDLRWTVQISK